jgi:hypothetical protein
MNNQYVNMWAVKVFAPAAPKPGDVVQVTTKAGKVKPETVALVIGAGTDNGAAYSLVTTKPKAD